MKDETIKVLSLSWIPNDDVFRFIVHPLQLGKTYLQNVLHTNELLSFIARLYDSFGWAARGRRQDSPIRIVAPSL